MTAIKIEILGGLGEVGMNCMLIRYGDHSLILDCGMMSSNQPLLGFDAFLPNFKGLVSEDINTLLITHGHEDHIGGISFFIDHLKIKKVICTAFTYELIQHKLNSYQKKQVNFEVVAYNEKVVDDVLAYTFHKNTHSIVESSLVEIHTPEGRIIHSGDFKLDVDSYADESYLPEQLEKIKKPLLLMSDSTNAEQAGTSRTEGEVYRSLKEKINHHHDSQVFISFFSSNLHRLKMLLDITAESGRPLVIVGRSLWKFYDFGIRSGYLAAGQNRPYYPEEAAELINPVLICTGSQGDYNAALGKILRNEWQTINIKPGDVFIHSALKIPGNEINIRYLLNTMAEKGMKIYHQRDDGVHASGHAYKAEQQEFFKRLAPKYFLPVHGDYMMLHQHIENIKEVNTKADCQLAIDGDELIVTKESFTLNKASQPPAKLWYRGQYVSDVEDKGLRARKKLARNGVLIFSGYFESDRFYFPPLIQFIGYEVSAQFLEELKSQVLKRLKNGKLEINGVEGYLKKEFQKKMGWKPEVVVQIS